MPRSHNLAVREIDTLLSARMSGFKSYTEVWLLGENPSRGAFSLNKTFLMINLIV